MHRLNCCLWILGLATCAVTSIGCSSGKTTIDTEYVEGLVTLDGEPVAGATVTFQPVDQEQGVSATGKTDANGVYKLTAVPTGELAAEPGAGTLAGEYYVGVVKTSFPMMEDDEGEEEEGTTGGVTEEVADASESDSITFIVPQKYNNPRESGLKKTVKAGENEIPIELTSE